MSAPSFNHVRHPRLARIAITGTVLVASTLSVVLLSAGLPTRAAAASMHSAVVSSVSSTPVLSDRQIIADAAPERAALAAERVKAEAAAASAASAAAAKARAARAAAASLHTVNVWTAGFQSQINACRGAVDVTAHYGTRSVALHWQCGGRSFPTAAGTPVRLTGLDAGTYRVVGIVAVLNAYTAHTSQIPRGYDMLVQTCRNGDSHTTEFVALQKVG